MEKKEPFFKSEGHATITVDPDEVVLKVNLTSKYPTNEEANRAIMIQIEKIKKILEELGMEDIKVESDAVNVRRLTCELYDENNHRVGDKVIGFESYLSLQLKINWDRPSINRLLELIGKRLDNAEISVSYNLKDATEVKKRALIAAVKDSRLKAEVIVNECHYKLDKILSISESCSTSTDRDESHSFFNNANFSGFCFSGNNDDVKPCNIVVTAHVGITWSIAEA